MAKQYLPSQYPSFFVYFFRKKIWIMYLIRVFYVHLHSENYNLQVRYFIYILSFLLLMICPSKGQVAEKRGCVEKSSEVLQIPSENPIQDQLPNKELLLTSAQNLVTIGEEGGVISIVRIQHQDERNHSAKKTPFRIIKNGKNIDFHRHPFLLADLSVLSGILSKERYLLAIQILRI